VRRRWGCAAPIGRIGPAAETAACSVRPGVGRAGAGHGVCPLRCSACQRLPPPMVSPGMGHAQLPGIAPDRPCLAPPPVRVNVAADAKRPCFLRVSHCLAPLHFPFLRPRCVYFGRPCGLAARLYSPCSFQAQPSSRRGRAILRPQALPALPFTFIAGIAAFAALRFGVRPRESHNRRRP